MGSQGLQATSDSGSSTQPLETVSQLRESVKELEARLNALQARYTGLVENLSDIVFAVDASRTLISLGGNTIGILGLPPYDEGSTPLADRLRRLVHSDDLPLLQEQIDKCLAAPDSTQVTVRVTDTAGEVRYLEAHMSSTILEGTERPVGVSGIVRDVTERVRAQQLMASLNRAAAQVQRSGLNPHEVLTAVIHALAEMDLSALVLLGDESGESLHVAEVSSIHGEIAAMEEILGRPSSTWSVRTSERPLLARTIAGRQPTWFRVSTDLFGDLISPKSQHFASVLASLFDGQQLVIAPMVTANEEFGVLLVYGRHVDRSVVPGIAAFANQTAIALGNAILVSSLRDSEAQYQSVFDSVTDGLVVWEEDGHIITVNRAVCEMYGYARDELLGMDVSRLIHSDKHADLLALRQGIDRDGNSLVRSLGLHKDGRTLEIEIHGASFLHKEERRFLWVVTDVTERMQSYRALVRSEQLSALGQMAGGIAHDFNNLLASIRGRLNLALLEMDENPALARRDLELAVASSEDAAEAVRRLQSLYRPPDDTSDFGPVVLDAIVRDVVALTRPRWKDEQQYRGITIEVITDLQCPQPVMGNAGELRRVVTNLVLNAVDAMPHGGRLTVRTWSEGEWSGVSVSDTGVGMTDEQKSHLFEPFYTTKGTAGSGLGLTMSLRIIERHGGKISVASEPAVGSTFTVWLPSATMAETEQQAAAEPQAPVQDLTCRLHVLAVDDEPAVLSVLTRLLERAHQRVTTASSGEEAIARLQEQSFDLLITDLGMPNISGHQVAEAARALYPAMPIVLATGWGETISPDQLARLGAAALLAKPFAHDDLVQAVEKALSST